MSSFFETVSKLGHLDQLSRKDSPIHRLHPLAKLLVTAVYLFTVISFDSYQISALIPYLLYPLLLLWLADIPLGLIFKRVLLVEPLIIGIGILNPIFSQGSVSIEIGLYNWEIPSGWIIFVSIVIKCTLTVSAGLCYLVTTGMERIAQTLRLLRVPRIFVLQLVLTYRYISVLLRQLGRTVRAYHLRAPGPGKKYWPKRRKGIDRSAWGSLLGQMILRTFDRAERIYISMRLRHFHGEYYSGPPQRFRLRDLLFCLGCSAIFIAARYVNLSVWLGNTLLGGIH